MSNAKTQKSIKKSATNTGDQNKKVYVNPLAAKVVNREVEVCIEGASTGLILEVVAPSDPRVKAVEAKHRRENFSAKTTDVDPLEYAMNNMDQRLNERVVAHVAGWRWAEGVAPELAAINYSEEQLTEFLKTRPFGECIREQVLGKVAREGNFIEMPAAV